MLKQLKFPPLPKIKPPQSSLLKIKKINAENPMTQVVVQKHVPREIHRQKSLSNEN